MYLGRELVYEIFLLGVYLLRDVVRTYVFFFFSSLSYLDTLLLHCDSKPCTLIDIYIGVVITFFQISLHMLFLFSLYAHASY